MSSIGSPTKKPALTPVNTGNAQLDNFVKNVIQIHNVEEGIQGKGESFKLDKKPSYRELVALGLVIPKFRGGNLSYTGNSVDGFQPGNGQDPVPDYSGPDTPTGFTATGGYGVIFLGWDDPRAISPFPFYSHTEIWRSSTDSLASAALLGTSVSSLFSDAVAAGQTYYYWIRFVKDVKGTIVYGAFNDSSGTVASSAEDPAYILEQLEGAITESHLYSTLNSRIDLIDGDVGLSGSVDARINSEAIIRADADTALSALITTLGSTVSGNTAAISSEASTRASADSAIASDVTTLQSTVGGHTASITTLTSTTDGIAAEQYVKLDVNGYVAGFGIYNDGPGASGFLVNADYFAVGKFGETSELPFIVGTVGGVTKIALNAATFIPDATITTAKIGTAAITSAKIDDLAVTTAKLAYASIYNVHINDASISTAKIEGLAVTTAKIDNLAVTEGKIGNLAVDTLKIQDNAVTVPQYTSGSGGTVTTSWATAVSITVNWGSNIPAGVSVHGSANFLAGGAGTDSLAIRFRQSSTGATDGDVGVSAASGFSVGITGTAGFVPNTTTETYYLEVKGSSGASYTLGSKNLLILGIKK